MTGSDLPDLKQIGLSSFSIAIAGHSLACHLLNIKEELQVSRLCFDYENTLAFNSALKTATFALAVDSVDSAPFFYALNDDFDKNSKDRFTKAQSYFRGVIEKFWEAYAKEQEKQTLALDSLKKKSKKP